MLEKFVKLNAMGWKPATGLKEGIAKAYDWYCRNAASAPTGN